MGTYAEPLPLLVGRDPDECPMDGGKLGTPPPKMVGGRIIEETANAFCWGYFDHGRLTHALIAPWEHLDVPAFMLSPAYADSGRLYVMVRRTQPEIGGMLFGMNMSMNDGFVAGQRRWHAHLWVLFRRSGSPSETMGLNRALQRLDGLVTDVRELAESLTGPYPGSQLRGFVHKATQP